MKNSTNDIHINQPLDNCYIDKGDLIEVYCKDGEKYIGEIIDIGIRIQNGSDFDGIHPCITIGILPKYDDGKYDDLAMFWVENLKEIKVLRLGDGNEQKTN